MGKYLIFHENFTDGRILLFVSSITSHFQPLRCLFAPAWLNYLVFHGLYLFFFFYKHHSLQYVPSLVQVLLLWTNRSSVLNTRIQSAVCTHQYNSPVKGLCTLVQRLDALLGNCVFSIHLTHAWLQKIYHWLAYTMLACYSAVLNNNGMCLVVSFMFLILRYFDE